nr:unnamed protein product [Callosobruchus chinensis]
MGDTSRKRRAKPGNYQRTKIKEARISGTEYVNCKGRLVAAKRPGEACRNVDREKTIRKTGLTYFVKKKGDVRSEVCLKAFLSILFVTEKRLFRIKRLAVLGMSPRDMRGKNTSGNALTEAARLCMREHIESFPKKESHYSGREVYYLDSNINIEKMHNLFKIRYPMYQNISYASYYKFFVENFKLSFGRPQVDVCGTCETYKIKIKDDYLNETAKRVAVAEYLVHKRRTKKFYDELKSETEKVNEPHILALWCTSILACFIILCMTPSVLELLKLRSSSKVWWNMPLILIRVEIVSYFSRQHHVILWGKYQLNRKI